MPIVGTPVSVYVGYFAARRDDGYLVACGFATALFFLAAGQLRSEEGFRSFQWRLPVRSRTVVNVELGLVLGMFL